MTDQPYRERIAEAVQQELAPDERLLAATRLVLPRNNAKVDEQGNERDGLLDMALLQNLMIMFRPPPKPVPGFPVHWDVVAALTRHRIVLWKPRRGSHQPSELLGAVQLVDLADVQLATVADARGRSLAVKFSLRNGPRVMLDVMAGFRADTEEFVEQVQTQLRARGLNG